MGMNWQRNCSKEGQSVNKNGLIDLLLEILAEYFIQTLHKMDPVDLQDPLRGFWLADEVTD